LSDTKPTAIDLYEATFLTWGKIDISDQITLVDGYYGEKVVPEFPLGLELVMVVALAVPVVYLWRTRKWVGKK
jgi:hypothetical protein